MSVSKKEWEDFKAGPIWKEFLSLIKLAEDAVIRNVLDNTELFNLGRDNFPEVKFERGKYHALQVFKRFPELAINESFAQDMAKTRKEHK